MENDKKTSLLSVYSQYIHLSRYARWNDALKRRETWEETVDRFVNFFKDKFGEHFDFSEIRDAILNLEVLPSMRCLWTAGKALQKDNAAGFNCAYVAIDSPKAFSEIFYLLLVGCFHPDQLIKTSSGDKKISEINLNDEVMTYDESTQQYYFIKPDAVMQNDVSLKEIIELEFDTGEVIQCTSDHKFLTQRGWVEAKDLTEDDVFQS